MKMLVCGGRKYNFMNRMFNTLDKLHKKHNITKVIHGGASGADTLAGMWGATRDIEVTEYRADWEKYGKKAGPIRNQQMLDEEHPDICIGFGGGIGTSDMIKRAIDNHVEKIYHDKSVMEELPEYPDGRVRFISLSNLNMFVTPIFEFYACADLCEDRIFENSHGMGKITYELNFVLFNPKYKAYFWKDLENRYKDVQVTLNDDTEMTVQDLLNEYNKLIEYLEDNIVNALGKVTFLNIEISLPNLIKVYYARRTE